MDVIKSHDAEIKAMHTIAVPDAVSKDLIIHLNTEDAGKIEKQLKGLGFHVDEREHHAC